jgi:hypothetical protein
MNRPILPTARLRPFPPILWALLLLLGGCADLHESVRTGDLRAARAMLKTGAAADEPDPAGTTPLMVAARMGDARLATLLLKHGADIDRQNRAGQSALSVAWEHGRELTFRMLLDRGAAIHFEADVDRLPPEDRRRGLWKLAEEERLFRKIAAAGPDATPQRFDEYLERYPRGRRSADARELLAEAAKRDFAALGDPPDPALAAAFVRDYGAIGDRAFRVTASRLNIRADAATEARVVGQYAEGDVVQTREARPRWLRTGRGWISRAHVQPARKPPAELAGMLKTARALAGSARPAAASRRASSGRRSGKKGSGSRSQNVSAGDDSGSARPNRPAARRRPAEAGNAEAGDRSAASPDERRRAERQLATVMETPNLKGLEAFILAYKDRSPFDDLVTRARDAYREMLLREVTP